MQQTSVQWNATCSLFLCDLQGKNGSFCLKNQNQNKTKTRKKEKLYVACKA